MMRRIRLTPNIYLIYFELFFSIQGNLVSAQSSQYEFPPSFVFGVATSAFQIDGAWNTSGKGASMWDTHIHKNPDFVTDKSNADIACDSYHNYMRDIEMIKELGVRNYRMSVSWTRLLPNGTDHYINPDGIRYYNDLFNALLENGITPFVTLFHWEMPEMFMEFGGWTNPLIVDYFEEFARVVFELFGDRVKHWTTLNEPHQHCSQGYGLYDYVPAMGSGGLGEYLCSHYSLLAHARVYHLYDTHFRPHQKGTIGITMDQFWGEPKNANSIEDQEASERYLQMHLGMYAHPIFSEEGDYPKLVRERIDKMSATQGYKRSRLPHFTPEEVEYVRGTSDFFGINHYTSMRVSLKSYNDTWHVPSLDHDTGVLLESDPAWPQGGSWWLNIYPEGFRKLMIWMTKNYGTKVPIIITENGVSDRTDGVNDFQRVSYFNNYLEQLLLAIHEDGCRIEGYFAWTLMDDFEWNVGYTERFGLYAVDFNDPKRTRTPKLSAFNYKETVRTRRINHSYITDHFNSIDSH